MFNLKNAASVADRGAPIGMGAKVSTTSSGSKRGRGRPLGSKNKLSSQESAKNFAKDGYPGGIQRRNSKMDEKQQMMMQRALEKGGHPKNVRNFSFQGDGDDEGARGRTDSGKAAGPNMAEMRLMLEQNYMN